MSEDPIGFAGGDSNLYRYAGNSPTNATDPSGQIAISGGVAAALIIGTLLEGAGRSMLEHSVDQYDEMAALDSKALWTPDDVARYRDLSASAAFHHGWGETIGMSGILVAASPLFTPLYGVGAAGVKTLGGSRAIQAVGGLVFAGSVEKLSTDALFYTSGLDAEAFSRYRSNPGRTAFEFGASFLGAGLSNLKEIRLTLRQIDVGLGVWENPGYWKLVERMKLHHLSDGERGLHARVFKGLPLGLTTEYAEAVVRQAENFLMTDEVGRIVFDLDMIRQTAKTFPTRVGGELGSAGYFARKELEAIIYSRGLLSKTAFYADGKPMFRWWQSITHGQRAKNLAYVKWCLE
jgi:hypothetical protein